MIDLDELDLRISRSESEAKRIEPGPKDNDLTDSRLNRKLHLALDEDLTVAKPFELTR